MCNRVCSATSPGSLQKARTALWPVQLDSLLRLLQGAWAAPIPVGKKRPLPTQSPRTLMARLGGDSLLPMSPRQTGSLWGTVATPVACKSPLKHPRPSDPRDAQARTGLALTLFLLQEAPDAWHLVERLAVLWGEVVGCIVWGSALLWLTIQSTVFPEVAVISAVDTALGPGGEARGAMQQAWGALCWPCPCLGCPAPRSHPCGASGRGGPSAPG